MQTVKIRALVRELTAHIPHGKKKPEHKQQKQYCNEFNKDFKNSTHTKNLR